ncbi:MAG: ABC transporter ATP-binding protein [Planctomycetaceae bacterium]|nr:ABC transporter ATP-binding protein [Planctomycetaceae bacterium]
MTEAIVSMNDVTKQFGSHIVLDGVNLSIRPGTVTGLLGRNGAGKSTLLKCALGIQRPQSGMITTLGESAERLSATAKARLGYVPQDINLYAWMKVYQIIAYTKAFYPRWNDQLANHLLDTWQLDRHQRTGTLSTGQTQSLAIILALGHEPDLLVLDEPVASLDPSARRQFLATLLDVAVSGERTILFSTHITSDIERVADQIAVLQDGRVTWNDELSALKETVKRLRIRTTGILPDDIRKLPGLLSCTASGNGAMVSVRDFHPQLPQQLRDQWQADVDVEDLNLEEIFLELHHV